MPPEILREIFKQLMWKYMFPMPPSISFGLNVRQNSPDWLRVAFVCRYWRSIVLSYPALFSSVHMLAMPSELVSRCLEYSQPAPLQISCEKMSLLPSKIIAVHGQRVSVFRTGYFCDTVDLWPSFPAAYFLGCSVKYDEAATNLSKLLTHFPNLEYLHIDAHPSLDLSITTSLPMLTHLILHQCSLTFSLSVQMLNLFPKLQVLEWENPWITDHSDYASSSPKTSLHRLTLSGSMVELKPVFKLVPDSRVMQLRLRLHKKGRFLDDLISLLQVHRYHSLEMKLYGRNRGAFRVTSYRSYDDTMSHLSNYDEGPDRNKTKRGRPAQNPYHNIKTLNVRVTSYIRADPKSISWPFIPLLERISDHGIQSMRLPGLLFRLFPSDLERVVQRFAHLETLHIPTPSSFDLPLLVQVNNFIRSRNEKHPKLRLLWLDSTRPISSAAQGTSEVQERDVILQSLRALVGELRLSEGN